MAVIVFTSAARLETARAVRWYDRRQVGLGDRLLEELDDELSRIVINPAQFPVVGNGVRRAALQKLRMACSFVY